MRDITSGNIQGEPSPGKVGEDQCSLLWRHLVLLRPELVEQLFPHRLEDRLEQRTTEDERGLVVGKAGLGRGAIR